MSLKNKEKAMRGVRRDMNNIAREFMVEADSNVVTATPILFGVAAANWLPSIDEPRTETKHYPNTEEKTVQPTESAKDFPEPDHKPATYYLSNNLPYIESLNDGASEQTQGIRAGFVERAARAAARKIFRRYK